MGARGEARVLDQGTQTGYLRHLVLREGRNTGQVLVQLVTAKGKKFEEGYLVEVLRRFPEVRSIHWAVNDTPAEVTNLPTVLLWGEDAIEEEILGLRFRVRPNAFLQTNTEMAEKLYSIAREFAALTGGETVYDLYCGPARSGWRSPRRRSRCGGWRSRRNPLRARSRTRSSTGSRMPRSSRATVTRDRGAARALGPSRRCRDGPAAGRTRRLGDGGATRRAGSTTSRAIRRRSRPT